MRVPSTIIRDGKPMTFDEEVGLVVADAVEDVIGEHLERKRSRVIQGAVGAVVGVVLGAILVATGTVRPGIGIVAVGLLAGGAWGGYALTDDPDVTVTSAEKRLWTGHLVPQSGGMLVYDATASIPRTEFELERIDDREVIEEAIGSLDGGRDLPVVLGPDENVETRIRDDLREVRTALSETNAARIDAPVVERNSDLLDGIRTVADCATEPDRDVSSIEVELTEAKQDAERIEELETVVSDTDAEETLETLKANGDAMVDEFATTTEEMVRQLNDHTETTGEILSMVSYNFYCPTCIEDDIYSTLEVGFDDGPRWFCDTCRGTFESDDDPVPKHRVKDELVEEVWDRLWIEKDDERRRIYENIEDQKAELKEREFEQRQEAIRDTWGRIKEIRSKIRDLRTEAKAKRGAVEEIGKVMEEYRRLSEERRRQFERDVQEAIERVERETEAAIEDMRNYEQEKIDESQKEAQRRAKLEKIEERKRHQEKVAALEAIQEQQEDLLEEQREHHRRELLLETRGETSMFDSINKYHLAKGKVFGFSRGD